MDIIQAIILSIVEGVTEFIPISSTGHLVLTSHILQIEQTEFVKSFEIIIQLGAILAIIFLYRNLLLTKISLWRNIIAAFIPTAVIGFLLYGFIKESLLGNPMITVTSLFVGGIFLIIAEKLYHQQPHHQGSLEKMSLHQALFVGLIQSVSIVPGVSRSAASILGGMYVGLQRKTATEFSFLLAIPTMLGATSLDLVKSNFSFSSSEWILLAVGFIGSFIVALIVVKWFLSYVQNNNFIIFGVYRIILAIVFYLMFLR